MPVIGPGDGLCLVRRDDGRGCSSPARTILGAGDRASVPSVRHLVPERWHAPTRVDLTLASGLLLLAQLETWLTAGYEPRWAYALAAAAMTVPLVWRRSAPTSVAVLVLAVLVVMDLTGSPLDSAYIIAVLLLAVYSVGAYLTRRGAIVGGVTVLVGLGVLITVESGSGAGDFVFVGAILTGAWVLAVGLRARMDEAAELGAHAVRLELDRETLAQQAVADERGRIARELHDVIAHSMSIVVVQTGAVRRRLARDLSDEADQLAAVEETARQALREMRLLLGILRSDGADASLAPQPGLADLDRLLTQLRESGLEVDLRVVGERRPLPAGLDLTAYRVVQESLVNVLKHAGIPRATVVTRYDEAHLDLEVVDTGGQAVTVSVAGGHGLIGMRERVQLYGGSFRCGVEESGGFAVRARLPLGRP